MDSRDDSVFIHPMLQARELAFKMENRLFHKVVYTIASLKDFRFLSLVPNSSNTDALGL